MGQSQSDEHSEASSTSTLEDEYASLNTTELQALAVQRGLPVPVAAERALLLPLLRSYDIGRRVGSGGMCSRTVSHESDPLAGRGSSKQVCSSVLSVLQKIRDAPGHMGCDIGGSLAKMVMAFPEDQAEQAEIFPEKFGTSGRCHRHLQMTLKNADQSFLLTFLSGATSQLEEAVAHLGDCRRQASEGHLVRLAQLRGSAERERSPMSPGRESEDSEGRPFARTFSSWSDEVFTSSNKAHRRMATAGGGACKFAPLFRDALRVELEPVREMRAMVDGFLLLAPSASLGTDSTGGSNELSHQDIFTINEDGTTVSRPWPEPLFPLILVIMGTGVSVLRVNSAQCGDFVRVGGTACGGGTFLGLARLLTSATSFEEALEMVSWGDASNADKLVSDIYGEEGCSTLGLPGNLTASNFGKLGESVEGCCENDLARSLLQMVTQQSVLLASAHARLAGCINRVFFAGGFVDEKNVIARKSIALNFRNLGGCAYFLRHSDFLGALGSLQGALRAAGGDASPK